MSLHQRLQIIRLRAGLTFPELAIVFGSCRAAVQNWTYGKTLPVGLRGREAEHVAETLVAAVNRGLLPLPRMVDPAGRAARVAKMREQLVVSFAKKLGE